MDLDYHKRDDLRKYFISQYIMKSNDVKLSGLVYFLMCYKACVRAKVSLFRARNEIALKKDKRISRKIHRILKKIFTNKRMEYVRESEDHLKLAESYLEFL